MLRALYNVVCSYSFETNVFQNAISRSEGLYKILRFEGQHIVEAAQSCYSYIFYVDVLLGSISHPESIEAIFFLTIPACLVVVL